MEAIAAYHTAMKAEPVETFMDTMCRVTVKLYGRQLLTKSGKPRTFKSIAAAEAAAKKALKAQRKMLGI